MSTTGAVREDEGQRCKEHNNDNVSAIEIGG